MSANLTRIYQVLDQVAAGQPVPRHLREEIDRELLPGLFAQLQQASHSAATVCAFWPGGQPATWCVGDPDAAHVVPGGRAQAAVLAAWRAIAGELPLCTDVAIGDHAERTARRMVRTTAPAWAARHCPPLAAAFGRILIRDGRLQYTPGGAVRVRFASGLDRNEPPTTTIAQPQRKSP